MTIAIFDLAGSAGERGKALGAERGKQIESYLTAWSSSLQAAGIADPRSYLSEMLRDTDFSIAIRDHTPDLLQEVEGVAAAADLPLNLVLASQLMDEEWAYRPSFQSRSEAMQKCSSVAIRSDGGVTWIGQNMDLPRFTDGHQVLLRIASASDQPAALVFSVGGMLGLLGVNARGLGVCVNSLPQLPSASVGLPVAFVVRKLLQASSVDAAARLIHELPHATGQHYLLAGPTAIRSFEASPAGVVEYHSPDARRVLHTNHPLAAADVVSTPERLKINSVARLASLSGRLMNGNPALEAIKAALSSCDDPNHPVCRVAHDAAGVGAVLTNFTTGSMISALRQGASEITAWVSEGPPNSRGYTNVSLPAAE